MSVVHMRDTAGLAVALCEEPRPFEFSSNWDLVTCRYCLAYVCSRCNYDTHYCPGCGANLSHGVETCEDCIARINHESGTGENGATHHD